MDPENGSVTYGKTLTYYRNGFVAISDGFNKNRGPCAGLTALLQADSGHCGAWADFLTMVLAFQGITAKAIGLGHTGNFYAGPVPAAGDNPYDYAYMLVGASLWKFKNGTVHNRYVNADPLRVTSSGQFDISGSAVTYSSTKPIAQGLVSTPPMWFIDGDHAIVEASLPGGARYVDPSYGNPKGTGYYKDLRSYEDTAIAGFAVVYAKVGTRLEPLTYADLGACVNHACYFQAVKL